MALSRPSAHSAESVSAVVALLLDDSDAEEEEEEEEDSQLELLPLLTTTAAAGSAVDSGGPDTIRFSSTVGVFSSMSIAHSLAAVDWN